LSSALPRHKSILTTAVYSRPTDEDLLRAVTTQQVRLAA
jgi:hypothetical protein